MDALTAAQIFLSVSLLYATYEKKSRLLITKFLRTFFEIYRLILSQANIKRNALWLRFVWL